MKNYFVRKTLLLIPILFAVITIVFAFLRLIPGDPVEAMLGEGARSADVASMRKALFWISRYSSNIFTTSAAYFAVI